MLASGRESDFYFDLRPTTIHPAGATCVGELICDALEGIDGRFRRRARNGRGPDRHGGRDREPPARRQPAGAFFVRKKPKDHGAKKMIEGLPKGETLKGKNVVVVEDATTTGGSSMQAVKVLREEGANIVLRADDRRPARRRDARTSPPRGWSCARSIRRMSF